MQDNEKKPALRFKGFTDPWEQRKFSDITFPAGEKNRDNLPLESYSITNEHGFIPQDEKFENGGTMREADKRMYYIVSPNSFAYNPARINVGSIGYQNTGKDVIVSSLYEVFKTSDDVDDRLLWHWFKSPDFQKLIFQLQEGGVRLYFYYDTLCMGTVSLPSLEEQRKIGQFFDSLDTLITLHQRKYEKLVNIKKSMLDKMFPQNGASVPEIRFKSFTDPWEQRKLGDITVELSEYATQELGLPLLTSSRSGLMYQDEYRDSRTTKSTETLFSVVPVGTCTYRHMSDDDVFHMNINTLEKGLVSREYPVFEASKGNNLEFLVQHINSSEEFKAFCAEQKKGGTRTRLYYNTLCQFTVRVPALKEQAQISQCLKKLDTLITLHQRKLEKLQNIKKSCLEKMFV